VTNLATGIFRGAAASIVVVVHNATSPTDEEWARYVENIGACLGDDGASGLAVTDGGGPNALQRGQINDALDGRRARSSVISSNIAVRGIVTALRWFNPDIAAFGPKDVAAATAFIGVEPTEIDAIWAFVKALDEQIRPRSRVVELASSALGKKRQM